MTPIKYLVCGNVKSIQYIFYLNWKPKTNKVGQTRLVMSLYDLWNKYTPLVPGVPSYPTKIKHINIHYIVFISNCGYHYSVEHHVQSYVSYIVATSYIIVTSYIVATSYIGEGNRSTEKPNDLPQVTHTLYIIMLNRVYIAMSGIG